MIKKRYFRGKNKGRVVAAVFSMAIAAGGISCIGGAGVIQPLMAYAQDVESVDNSAETGVDNDTQNNDSVQDSSATVDTSVDDTTSDTAQSANSSTDDTNTSADTADDIQKNAAESDDATDNSSNNEASDGSTTENGADGATDSKNEGDSNQSTDEKSDTSETDNNKKQHESYQMYVKIVDQKGNPIPDASIQVVTDGGESKLVKGSDTGAISSDYRFILSDLKLPNGYLFPKYGDYTMFNSNSYTIMDYDGTGDLILPHLHTSDVEESGSGYGYGGGGEPSDTDILNDIFLDNHISMVKNDDGSYTTSVKIDVAYYNNIGGNISGEEDPVIDDEYVIGSGETVTLVFKRVINDNETFNHFEWLSYVGPNEDKESIHCHEGIDYFIKPGSVQVELTAQYLEKLGAGTHIFEAYFDDSTIGVQAKIKIVDKKESANVQGASSVTPSGGSVYSSGSQSTPATSIVTKTTAAPTADKNSATLWAGVTVVSGSALVGLIYRRRKNSKI